MDLWSSLSALLMQQKLVALMQSSSRHFGLICWQLQRPQKPLIRSALRQVRSRNSKCYRGCNWMPWTTSA